MNLKDTNAGLHGQITSFINTLKDTAGPNLVSVFLYGGVAKADYTPGKSNVNLLFIFENVDLDVLDKISFLFQKGISEFRLAPFILTHSEIAPSADVFAIKLFDISRHHELLYGKDVLAGLDFEKRYLKFLSEQELSNQLARMKYFYIQNFNLPELLFQKIQKGITTLIINANTFLYLKHNVYYATRQQIAQQLLKEPEIDAAALNSLLTLKENTAVPAQELIKQGYDLLMIQYKQLLKAYKHVSTAE